MNKLPRPMNRVMWRTARPKRSIALRVVGRNWGKWVVLRAALWGLFLGLCIAERTAAADLELKRFESTQPQMGVPFKIILYAPDSAAAKGAFQAAFSRIAELNRVLSDYDSDSELSRLSRASPTASPVRVSDPLWIVLERSQALAARSGGAFDVTVGPYVRLWRRARRSGEMPSAERLAEAKAAVGYRLVQLDAATHGVRLVKPNMRLDLGGIAMGFAVDETLKLLRERGLTRALVDASGDIGVGDPPPGKQGWTIDAVPLSSEGTPRRTVLLANAAITTAGDAFQHVVIDGQRYSHIVDPRTGLGMTNSLGVAVIARDCITADSLDTAVSVMGAEAGMKLVEETPGAAAFILQPTAAGIETHESRRFAAYVVPDGR
jgi:FAD:protein FMN transferase